LSVVKERTFLHKAARWVKLKLLHIPDSPHRIALGTAIGVFVALSPVLGLHIVIALLFSVVLRANKLAAMVSVWVNNPLTVMPILYAGYLAGHAAAGVFGAAGSVMGFGELRANFDSMLEAGFYTAVFWRGLFDMLWRMGVELWMGCTLLGLAAAAVSYWATLKIVIRHRLKHPRRRYQDIQ